MKLISLGSFNIHPVDLINNIREKFVNIAVFMICLIVSFNIYKNQSEMAKFLKANKETETIRSEVLNKLAISEKKINFYKNLFNKRDSSVTINTINTIVKESGISIISIKPGTENIYSAYIRYPFTLAVNAENYHAIGKFISKIESHPDTYFIDKLSIERNEETGRISFDMVLSTVIFKN